MILSTFVKNKNKDNFMLPVFNCDTFVITNSKEFFCCILISVTELRGIYFYLYFQYTCFDVSSRYIAVGSNTGSVYIFDKNSLRHLQVVFTEEVKVKHLLSDWLNLSSNSVIFQNDCFLSTWLYMHWKWHGFCSWIYM